MANLSKINGGKMEEKDLKKIEQSGKPKPKSLVSNKILSFCAYIGIACIAIALLLSACFKGNTNVGNVFRSIGEVIAYILAIILAFFWVKSHKHIAWLICYIIFVVTIVVLYILVII